MRFKIKFRLLLILASVMCVYAVTLILLSWTEYRRLEELEANEQKERVLVLDNWIEMHVETLTRFVRDYSQWDDMLRMVKTPDPNWLKLNIDESLANFGMHAAWLLTLDGRLVHSCNNLDIASVNRPDHVLPAWLASAREERNPHFFWLHEGTLFEVKGSPVLTSADTKAVGAPQGWFFVARAWNSEFVAKIPRFIECKAELLPAGAPEQPLEGRYAFHVRKVFRDWTKRPVSVLDVAFKIGELEAMAGFNRVAGIIFAGFGLILFIVLSVGLHYWVLVPLDRIGESLGSRSPDRLTPVLHSKSEMGDISRLVKQSFEQQKALEREIEVRRAAEVALQKSEESLRRLMDARARLGRDLHDGVIQTLFATGMSLSGVRALMGSDAAEAARRLDQTQQALNDAIRDLREYIYGLEPEMLKQQTFAETVERLCEVMRAIRHFEAHLEIEEEIADRLEMEPRTHVLQIIREALSNALRHGEADVVRIALYINAEGAVLEIVDDGRGFDAKNAANSEGCGLANLKARAKDLGATLTIRSEIGKGTEIHLTIPLKAPVSGA